MCVFANKNKKMNENIVKVKSFEFALKIIDFSEEIFEMKRFSLADQIFKSGTSVGANVKEAQSPESLRDFIHKMKIAHKEAEEIEYWLLLCKHSKHLPFYEHLLTDARELLRIIGKIISTSKAKLNIGK